MGTLLVCYPASHFNSRDILFLFYNPHTLPRTIAHFDTDLSSETSLWSADTSDLYLGGRPPNWYDNDVRNPAATAPELPTAPAPSDLLTLKMIWDKKATTHPDRLHSPARSDHIILHPIM